MTTLIIAPVALMRQWQKEIAVHIKDQYKLSVYLYHGNGKKADFNILRQYDVVLTTFGTLTSEYKQKESRKESMLHEQEINQPGFRRPAKDRLALLGRECMWYRVVVDEAHTLKNRNSKASKASVDIQAKHRLCLTGTPMMNSIDELYPLLRFLRVDRYDDWKRFAADIAKVCIALSSPKSVSSFRMMFQSLSSIQQWLIGSSQPAKAQNAQTRKKALNRVQILLKAVLLRRGKNTEVDGKPILNLPAKVCRYSLVCATDTNQLVAHQRG